MERLEGERLERRNGKIKVVVYPDGVTKISTRPVNIGALERYVANYKSATLQTVISFQRKKEGPPPQLGEDGIEVSYSVRKAA